MRDVALLGHSVVVRGVFAPKLFSPSWLLSLGLIGQNEYEVANVELITNDLSVIDMGWLRCHVSADTLNASTVETAHAERVRDFVVGVLASLSTSPVAAMGFNHEVHLSMSTPQAWHRVGDRLTPKEFWDPFLALPGMRGLSMLGVRPDDYAGRIQVTVEPSTRFPLGVYVAYNDHYDLTRVESQPKDRQDAWDITQELDPTLQKRDLATEILSRGWSESQKRAFEAFERIDNLARTETPK